jgi:two-component system, LytTR family, sensor kinase
MRDVPWGVLTRRLFLAIAAACTVTALLDAFQVYMNGVLSGQTSPSWRDIIWQGGEWLIFGALTPLAYFFARRFPLRRPHVARNLLPHFGAALVVCVGWASAGITLRWLLGIEWSDAPRGEQLASWLLISLPWSVFLYFAVLGTIHAVVYFTEAREREAHAAQLSSQLANARLDALRMQLHPHFLFNSLNAITVLVRDNETKVASRMLELLSDVLRRVLRSNGGHEIALAEELELIEQYLAIEQVRFSDRLRVVYSIAPDCTRGAVPRFALQPLVENALRHGLGQLEGEGHLEVGARREGEDLVLWVRDDGPGFAASTVDSTRSGVGLANTRERLATLYGDRAHLDLHTVPGAGTTATIRMPYHPIDAAHG